MSGESEGVDRAGGTPGQPGRPAGGAIDTTGLPDNSHHPLDEAIDEPVHESRDFPGGGGEGQGAEPGPITLGGAGSTGRDATEGGAADASGASGGGMAGGAGG